MQYLCLYMVWNKIAIKNPYEKMNRKMGAVCLLWFFGDGKVSFGEQNQLRLNLKHEKILFY